ncbi:hypothetical protein QTO34_003185 [Cnephaeus nilssonii]|uniref:Outer dense fiber protein 3 n=1 Tax=Cnephaeus nilssonii TaxID=3371016 RepID=A0AA40LL38_CNENI|nr:hypothetical protein QTO34_003185 [Eptesicus nilssonii]
MTEEVWVGTWRPHRPRGPIMALYSSPGPKYLIPPTTGRCRGLEGGGEGAGSGHSASPPTGFVKHTPTKLRAPAYSFRGAPLLLTENCSPGPRYSVNPKVLRTGKDLGPAFSILGRYHTKTTMTPGPGDYFPEKSTKYVFDSAPSHSISARTKTFRVDSTPGPAAYHQTDVQVTKLKAPQYTIAARVEPPGDKTLKPGPGAHSPEKVTVTKPCAPIVTFGIKHSDYMTPLILQVD